LLALSFSHGIRIVTLEAGLVIKPKELGIVPVLKVVVLQGLAQVTVADVVWAVFPLKVEFC
jgi:hypothetical protein